MKQQTQDMIAQLFLMEAQDNPERLHHKTKYTVYAWIYTEYKGRIYRFKVEYQVKGAVTLSIYNADTGFKLSTILLDKDMGPIIRLAITKSAANPSLIVNNIKALDIILVDNL